MTTHSDLLWHFLWGQVSGQDGDEGMTAVEYAIGTVVAAAFAAVLYRIVTGTLSCRA